MRTRSNTFVSLLTLLALVAPALAGTGTTITYQGRLTDGGQPATGPVDLAFRIYEAPNFGRQVGPELVAPGFDGFDELRLFTRQRVLLNQPCRQRLRRVRNPQRGRLDQLTRRDLVQLHRENAKQ